MKQEFRSKRVIVIVGGFLNGKYLPLLFSGLGYPCIHIAERKHLESNIISKDFDGTLYEEMLTIDTEKEINNFVKKWYGRIACVVAGSEPSVQLADYLNNLLCLDSNIFNLSIARRNKYFMHNTIKKAGIASAHQILSENIDDILNFFYTSPGKIVLKPPASASTDSVFYCTSEAQVRENFSHILGRVNVVNEINKSVLAQEYIDGTQYIVNAISSNGIHYVTDIWKEVRENDELPSNDLYADLVNRDTDIFAVLSSYIFSVLDALGVRTGPSHNEVRIRKDGTPCLIESASRLSGGIDMSIVHQICGVSSLSLIPDAFLNPERFQEIIKIPAVKIKSNIRHVYLFSSVEGIMRQDLDNDSLLEIESFSSFYFRFKKGDYLPKTSRAFLQPRPGSVYLINSNQEKLETDYKLLRFWEAKMYKSLL